MRLRRVVAWVLCPLLIAVAVFFTSTAKEERDQHHQQTVELSPSEFADHIVLRNRARTGEDSQGAAAGELSANGNHPLRSSDAGMLAMDPRVDTYDETRQLATQFVVFIVLIVLTVLGTRYFDEHGGPAVVRKWLIQACGSSNQEGTDVAVGAEEGYQNQPQVASSKQVNAQPEAAKQTTTQTASQQPTQSAESTDAASKDQPPRDLSSIPPSSPLFVLLGLASSFPLFAVTSTYPFCALLFPGAGSFLLSSFPIFIAASQLATVVLLSSSLAAPLSISQRLIGSFLLSAAFLMLLPLASFDLSASGWDGVLLLLMCLAVGGFTGACWSSQLALAGLVCRRRSAAASARAAAEGAEQQPQHKQPQHSSSRSSGSSTSSTSSSSGSGALVHAVLCGQGVAGVAMAVGWVGVAGAETRGERAARLRHPELPAAAAAAAAALSARILSAGPATLAIASMLCALGGYLAYRICASPVTARLVQTPVGLVNRRTLCEVGVGLKGVVVGVVAKAVASSLLFPGLLQSQESESGGGHGKQRPEYLATELLLVHAVCELGGRLLGPALRSLLLASPSFTARLQANRWLALAVGRGAGIAVGVLLLLALGWRDNAFSALVAAAVGASSGLLSAVLVLQGMADVESAEEEEEEDGEEEGKSARREVVGGLVLVGAESCGVAVGYVLARLAWL